MDVPLPLFLGGFGCRKADEGWQTTPSATLGKVDEVGYVVLFSELLEIRILGCAYFRDDRRQGRGSVRKNQDF
jgi:hypothetical protein